MTTDQHRRYAFLHVFSVLALGLWLAPVLLSQSAPGGRAFEVEIVDGHPAVAGEALVRFREARATAELRTLDAVASEQVAPGVRLVQSDGVGTSELVAALARRADVAYAEPNFVTHVDARPNDLWFPVLWGLFNESRPGADVNVLEVWERTTGSRVHPIAIIDSGIDYDHPDLRDNLWSAPAPFTVTVGGVSVTCPAGSHGFNTITFTCDPMDDHGHGTAMAGIIGATGNNGIGVTGVNWTSSLIAVKFLAADGFGFTSDAVRGLDFLLQLKARFPDAADVRVISNSWGGGGYSQAVRDQIARANDQEMLFVAASGNGSSDNDRYPHYPSSYDPPNVLAVTATTPDDVRAAFGNWGATSVDVGAPGPSNFSTARGGGYATVGGTSSATAFASGTAALLLSACELSTAELKQTLMATVDPVASLAGTTVTGGRIDADRAMRFCAGTNNPPIVRIVSPSAGALFSAPATMVLEAAASDSDGTVTRVDFYRAASGGTPETLIGSDTSAPFRVTWSGVGENIHRVYAVATDNGGAKTESPQVHLEVTPAPAAPPSPWLTQDIGTTGVAGSVSLRGDVAIVEGGGADVWGSSDDLRFVYQPLRGDGEIVARVAHVEAVDAWTKAGVMLRGALSPSAAQAFMLVSPARGLAFQRRRVAGGASTSTSGGSGTAPYWVRLTRTGSTITAARSLDGATWTTVASDTFTTGPDVFVGLAVSSHRRGELATTIFDSVQVRAAAPPPPPPPDTPGGLPAGWTGADIGSVGQAGTASGSGATFRVSGAGADVWGSADALHFTYRTLAGDGTIVARVADFDHLAPWTKVGVMMRGSLDTGAPQAFMLVSSSKGLAFQRRRAAGSLSTNTAGGAGTDPYWVWLQRRGSTITASRSLDGVSWTTVGEDTFAIGASVLVGLAVSSHDVTQLATATFDSVTVAAADTPPSPQLAVLPPGWSTADVGAVGTTGSAGQTAGTFTVAGAGGDVWGTADAFRFAYVAWTGDGSIVARVTSVENVAAWTKAGVMMRQSLEPGLPQAFMLVSPGKGLAYQRRTAAGGASISTAGGLGAAPRWVKLTRSGAVVSAWTSSDGLGWTRVGSSTFTMPGTIWVGLAVSSHDTARLATATFTNVMITGS